MLQVEPERGRILDANGNPLVDDRESRVVTVQQQLLGSDPEAVLFRLAQNLGVPEKDIRTAVLLPIGPVIEPFA